MSENSVHQNAAEIDSLQTSCLLTFRLASLQISVLCSHFCFAHTWDILNIELVETALVSK